MSEKEKKEKKEKKKMRECVKLLDNN